MGDVFDTSFLMYSYMNVCRCIFPNQGIAERHNICHRGEPVWMWGCHNTSNVHLHGRFVCCIFSYQGIGGRQAPMRETKPVNSRRYIATFDVENTTKGDSGRYRCIVHSDKGVGVSSYADLTVKRKSRSACAFYIDLPKRPVMFPHK